MTVRTALTFSILWLFAATSAHAAEPIALSVDATEFPRKLLRASMTIPAKPGPLTLVYPKWIPGNHCPSNPINAVVNLKASAGGKPIEWRRDAEEMHAFHLTVPEGASAVTVELVYLIPEQYPSFSLTVATAKLGVINWGSVLLYPQGGVAADVPVRVRLKLPAEWKHASALRAMSMTGPDATLTFEDVSLETLIDSPLLCGQHLRSIPLTDGQEPPVTLNLAADSPEALEIRPKHLAAFKRLPVEARAMLGPAPFDRYDFLVTLSDELSGGGLEHHRSSDNRMPERGLLDEERVGSSELLPHELAHAWNGKHRRPAGMTVPDYQKPLHTELVWVYEGLTSYLGYVLAARSGLATPQQARDRLAATAASMDATPGRAWRSLHDTAVAAPVLFGSPHQWRSWRRGTDFYPEGLLIWLEVDSLVRQKTSGAKSLDDFLAAFYGDSPGRATVKPYTLEDLCAALIAVAPNDWVAFFRARLDSTDPRAPLGGLTASGLRFVFRDKPSDDTKATMNTGRSAGTLSLRYSLGLELNKEGVIGDVLLGSPADTAGLAPGMKVTAIDNRRYSADVLKNAVEATKAGKRSLAIQVETNQYLRTLTVEYGGGPRWPHLERDPASNAKDLLAEIIKPKATKEPATAPAH